MIRHLFAAVLAVLIAAVVVGACDPLAAVADTLARITAHANTDARGYIVDPRK